MTSNSREKACAPVAVPDCMSATLSGYDWGRDLIGEAGASVYRLHGKPDAPVLYLKHGVGPAADDVTDEMVRLRWLTEYLPVPEVVRGVCTPDETWLLTTAIGGDTAFQKMDAEADARNAVVDELAAFLRRLHAIPVGECPFESGRTLRLSRARTRIDACLVDADDFDDERQGWTPERVWQALQDLLPLAHDPVVTHGDFSLDNILMRDGKVMGCIDVGRAGVADRYQDLAIAWNCLGEFGPTFQERLFRQYGIFEPDMPRLQFYLLLDELF